MGTYKLTAKAYMPPAPGLPSELLEPGTLVEYAGKKPGAHMLPVDPLDHDGDGKKGGGPVRRRAKVEAAPDPAPTSPAYMPPAEPDAPTE